MPPYAQSAPPYPTPVTGSPYQDPYQAAPPPAPPKKGRAVWFVGGFIAMALIAVLVLGGVVIGRQGGDDSDPKAAAGGAPSASASPSAAPTYRITSSLCAELQLESLRELAPETEADGQDETGSGEGFSSLECSGAIYATEGDTGRAVPGAHADYYQDPDGARKAFEKYRKDCRKADGEDVQGLGQGACIQHTEVEVDGNTALQMWIECWDGNLVFDLEIYAGGSLRTEETDLQEAMVADIGATLETLREA